MWKSCPAVPDVRLLHPDLDFSIRPSTNVLFLSGGRFDTSSSGSQWTMSLTLKQEFSTHQSTGSAGLHVFWRVAVMASQSQSCDLVIQAFFIVVRFWSVRSTTHTIGYQICRTFSSCKSKTPHSLLISHSLPSPWQPHQSSVFKSTISI